ncbi:ABC transporter ATP-binding protein [Streptomyces sp. DSM 41987]|uniref:ABC transporter ATP-binding protein n=1 Tax=Streptomyces TaxID=1883 RepID=UPI0018DF15E6|nr:ABC transporter ATP-binding protein [Streptomyces fildesensis]
MSQQSEQSHQSEQSEQPDEHLLPIANSRTTWRWLGGRLRERPAALALTLLVGLLGAAAAVVPAYALGILVDRVRDGAGSSAILGIAVTIAAAALVGGAATGLTSYLVARLGGQILAMLRERTVSRALTLPVTTLERAGRGDLLSRVSADVAEVSNALVERIPVVISSTLLGTLTLAAMSSLDWRLGLAGAVAVPLYVLALRWYLPLAMPRYAKQRKTVARSSQRLVESMQGRRTVHAYGLQDRHLENIDMASRSSRDVSVWVFDLFTRFVGRVNRAEFGGLSVILVTGFLLVREGTVTVGQAAAAAVLFHRLFEPIGMLLFVFDEVLAAGASLARLVGVVKMPPEQEREQEQEQGPGQVSGAPGQVPADASLDLTDVHFAYAGGADVLRGISMRVPAGSRVALVGSTGAGKSTLAAIVAGSLRPRRGTVQLGGVSPAALGTDGFRGRVALITQEIHVFAGPLIEDLRLASPGATVQRATEALTTVGALEWAEALPEGLDTVVGEGGHELTAAQAQQLALARLVLADPAVAVLDEATAEAGSLGARLLEESAAAATRGRTTLIVAHRLTQAASADRVVVLEHGRIVEEGSHETLVGAGGRYAQLWSAWESRTPTSPDNKVRLA